MRGDHRVEWPLRDQRQERLHRLCRDTPPPALAPDPVTDLTQALAEEADEMPRHFAPDENRPAVGGGISQNVALPVIHERVALARGEGRQPGSHGIELMLEEHLQILEFDGA